jgi:oligogalacturonide lyase
MREWTDELTGRTVRQLTDFPEGAMISYFRFPRRLPNGKILAQRWDERRALIALDVENGVTQTFEDVRGRALNLREADGRLWFLKRNDPTVWAIDLPNGTPQAVGELPEEWPRMGSVVTCDGKTVISTRVEVDRSKEYPLPTTLDPQIFWQWTSRPRSGALMAYDLETGKERTLLETTGVAPIHHDVSPDDPGQVKFAHDDFDAFCQRIWSVRTDGTGLTKIRPQERGELVTHEFWWPGGQNIAYKYQDRRNDATIHDLPWAEYSPIPTQIGLSNLAGEQWYLSDPINHYHTHINVSPQGDRLSGEGTDGHNFVYAAAFSPESTKIEFLPHASINTNYTPFKGQNVQASFSHDGEWIIFNNEIEGTTQVCAVKVEV